MFQHDNKLQGDFREFQREDSSAHAQVYSQHRIQRCLSLSTADPIRGLGLTWRRKLAQS